MRPAIDAAYRKFGSRSVRGVELGVAFGDNAVDMLEHWPELSLVCVDNFVEAPERLVSTGTRLIGPRVKFLQLDTCLAASLFNNTNFDFVYVDADHTYDGVMRDLLAWYPLVKPGGIFGGHDYANDTCPGVAMAVNHFVRPLGVYITVDPVVGDWWFVKPEKAV